MRIRDLVTASGSKPPSIDLRRRSRKIAWPKIANCCALFVEAWVCLPRLGVNRRGSQFLSFSCWGRLIQHVLDSLRLSGRPYCCHCGGSPCLQASEHEWAFDSQGVGSRGLLQPNIPVSSTSVHKILNIPETVPRHVNDVHAHLDQYRTSGTDCEPPSSTCVGGYARLKTKMNEIRGQAERSLVLNMGDEFQVKLIRR